MMEMLTPRDLFLDSLERCAADEGFLPTFYRRFLASSREVRDKFRHTDFEQQNEMLLNSLRLVAAATAGAQRGLSELKERAKTHDRHHLNIRPQLYEFWRVAIVLTASEFDPLWSDTTEDAWNRILGTVIDHMVRHY